MVSKEVDAELSFLWADVKLELKYQYAIAKAGWTSLRMFATLDDDKAALRKSLVSLFDIVGSRSLEEKLATSKIIDAWVIASQRVSTEDKVRTESKALGLQRELGKTEYTQMRQAVEKLRKKMVPDTLWPGKNVLQQAIDQVEENDPIAATLDQVLAITDEKDAETVPKEDRTGIVRMVRTYPKGALPMNAEQLRERMKTEGYKWLALATRFPNRSWLRDLTMEDSTIMLIIFLVSQFTLSR